MQIRHDGSFFAAMLMPATSMLRPCVAMVAAVIGARISA